MSMTAQEERAYILENFQQHVDRYKNKRIALYGLGINSEYIVKHQEGFNIVALMDVTREGHTYWGLPVISESQALGNVDVIVIVARTQSIPIIYERIVELEKSGIIIVNVLGERIDQSNVDEEIENNIYFNKEINDLLTEIENYEVITFDIFDTLIMRSILSPKDVFEIIEKVWNDRYGNETIEFAKLRMCAEKKAYEIYKTPTYEQIYDELQKCSSLDDSICKELMELEYKVEKNFIVPRTTMVQVIEKAWRLGKKVFL